MSTIPAYYRQVKKTNDDHTGFKMKQSTDVHCCKFFKTA